MTDYKKRIIDGELAWALRFSRACNIVGPRLVGKTTTARHFACSEFELDTKTDNELAAVHLDPTVALEGETPHLIDEWQLVPELWAFVRSAVDNDPTPGRFLLSGSAWPDDGTTRHSGAGRILDVRMRTMSLAESGDSKALVSWENLVSSGVGKLAESLPLSSDANIEAAAQWIVRGGWPAWIDFPPNDAQRLIRGYIEQLGQRDFPQVGGSLRDPARFINFVRAYASLIAQPVPMSSIGKRLHEEGITVGERYPSEYQSFAERLFIVEDQPAWSPNVRSRTRFVKTPKRHLVDPSLAAAALGKSVAGLKADPETLGLLFESLVVRDLRIYAQPHEGKVLHYRRHDATQEIDAIVEYPDGNWVAVEVKLGLARAEEAAHALLRAVQPIAKKPAAMLVITPGGPVADLGNGVWHVPLALLGP